MRTSPVPGEGVSYDDKVAAFERYLCELDGAVVAFSGGVDSTMLLWAAVESLGRARVVAVTALSPSFPEAERREAAELCASFGVEHRLVDTGELDRDGYVRNARDRCYFCKTELFDEIAGLIGRAEVSGWPVLYGAIADDLSDDRPGARAAHEHDVRAPLAELGFSKDEVRRWSRERGLPTADKPSFACLASRVPFGTAIDAALLARIERAEDALRRRGFAQFRVRHHGAIARIELDPSEIPRAAGTVRGELVEELRGLGWAFVTLDLAGFASGTMHALVEHGS